MALCQRAACPAVPRDALRAVAYPRAVSVLVALLRAGCAAEQPQAAEWLDVREPRAEPAALGAQHAAEAQEAAGAPLDAGEIGRAHV